LDLHIKKRRNCFYCGASEPENNSLQILGTLDKPSVEKEIELRINNEDILTMNDKPTKFGI
jgi:lipoprotein-releasing system ATP-binding protein